MNEKEKLYLKQLKNPILIYLEDLYEDVVLVCKKLKVKLNNRRSLNSKIYKNGINNYEFKLENFKKEEEVQIDEVRGFLKLVYLFFL